MEKNFEQRFNDGISHVKPFPRLIEDAISLIDSGDSDNNQLAYIIKQEPILAARILSLSNSSFYGMSRQVDSIETACVILGNNIIRNILVSAGALGCFPVTEQRKKIWLHLIEVASVSELLAKKFNQHQGNAYMAGLLHDVGKFLLLDLFPEYLNVIEEGQTIACESSIDEETKLLGFNHAQAGAKIITAWKLPQGLINVIEMHNKPAEADNYAACSLLYLANEVCHKLEMELSEDDLSKSLNIENMALLNIEIQEVKDLLPDIKSKISSLDGILEQL